MNVMQLHLIEKRNFTRNRMPQHPTAALPNAKIVLAIPLCDESLFPAGFLDYRAIVGLEEPLPTDVQPLGEIADIHQPFFFELLTHHGIKVVIDSAAVNNGRATT